MHQTVAAGNGFALLGAGSGAFLRVFTIFAFSRLALVCAVVAMAVGPLCCIA
jgi:hypothetical protein